MQTALPEADVVVHVEPDEAGGAVRERAHAAALGVPRVREVHNVTAVALDAGHRALASTSSSRPTSRSRRRTRSPRRSSARSGDEVPEVSSVQTHLEPLARGGGRERDRRADVARRARLVARIVRDETGAEPRELRFLHTDEGLVAYLTLRVGGETPLAEAHAAREPDRGADPPRAAGHRRRHRPHRATMKLCMFTPRGDRDLERGWPGRIDGDTRDPARGADAAGVLHRRRPRRASTPSIRSPRSSSARRCSTRRRCGSSTGDDFRFANPAAIVGAGAEIAAARGRPSSCPCAAAAIVGADGAIGGFTPLVEWTAPQLPGEKARDFALALGPVVTTPDEGAPPGADWERLVAHAAANTRLYPGRLIAA